jgi:peptide-methionine (S)-S-oxide reductase
MAEVILAGGCFWCIEAIFADLIGVSSVESGYIGGQIDNPTYKQICEGTSGHAEAIRVTFNPEQITRADLFDIFFHVHDPTQLNRQGNDVGAQYRSAIFYADSNEQLEASVAIKRAASDWPNAIVTTLEPATHFYVAEEYHQEYFVREGEGNSYCTYVVAPKVEKFRKSYASRLKNK